MSWRVKVTGSGVVSAAGKQYQEIVVPHGEYAMTKRADGRYELTVGARLYLLAAPEGADAYLDQKILDGTLKIIEGEWPVEKAPDTPYQTMP